MRLRGGLRDSDTVALLNSGHIGVLLQSVQGPQDLDLVINRLLARLEDPVQIENRSIVLQPRIGTALYPEHGDSVRSLIEYAENDLALTKSDAKFSTASFGEPTQPVYAASMDDRAAPSDRYGSTVPDLST